MKIYINNYTETNKRIIFNKIRDYIVSSLNNNRFNPTQVKYKWCGVDLMNNCCVHQFELEFNLPDLIFQKWIDQSVITRGMVIRITVDYDEILKQYVINVDNTQLFMEGYILSSSSGDKKYTKDNCVPTPKTIDIINKFIKQIKVIISELHLQNIS